MPPKHYTNKNSKITQNKLAVLIKETETDGVKKWHVLIVDPIHPEKLNGGYEFDVTSRFGIAHYYADYCRFLLGMDTEEPQPWNYDEKSTEVTPGIEWKRYNGTQVCDGENFVQLDLSAMPESNGLNNWTFSPSQKRFDWGSIVSFERCEEFYKALYCYHCMQYLLGEIPNEPNKDDYNMQLYRDYKTGEFYIPEKKD